MTNTTIADVRDGIRRIYKPDSAFQRLLVNGRPFICPLHTLVDCVPSNALVLDVGCGTGLFLNLLAHRGRVSRGIGFDASAPAIETAQRAAKEIRPETGVRFEAISVGDSWPAGLFDVVSMIDVLHHISPAQQRQVIEQACGKVAPGGMFLYKDMGVASFWRAWANRAHDLVLARQWIHYVAANDVVQWAKAAGLSLEHSVKINMLWYEHELFVFRRPASSGMPA